MSKISRLVIFSGRVQGVEFRFTAFNIANRYDLTGYVRNKSDGSVEMLMQGLMEDVDNCIKDIQESFGNYVSDTTVEEVEPDSKYTDYKITF